MREEFNWREKLKLNRKVKQKCKSFHENGYKTVKETDLWGYLLDYRWPRLESLTINEKIKDISAVTFNEFFDYQRIKAQTKAPNLFDWENMEDLL